MTEPAPRVLRMKLACKDHIQFLLEFAPKMKAKVFVPMEDPPPVGSRVVLHIRFSDGQVHVKGTAEVLKVVATPKPGVHARYVSLDPDSVQFPLGERAAPAPAASADEGQPTSGEAYVPPFSVSGEFRAHTPSAVATAPAASPPAAAPRPSSPPAVPAAKPSSPPAAARPSAPRVASVLNPPEPTAVTKAPPPPAAAPPVDPFADTATVEAAASPDLLALSANKTAEVPAAAEPTRVERAAARRAPAARFRDDDEVGGPPPPARSRWPLVVGAVAVLALVGGGAGLFLKSGAPKDGGGAVDPALAALLQKADARMASRDYARPGGDSALDHVRVAVKSAPAEPGVKKRQQALAEVFDALAKAAEAQGDFAEAAVQLQALALTEPSRPGVKERLAHAEDVVVNQKGAP